ncbi:makorin ring finger protein 1 [Homo sapiens]|uniref:Makorin ring finger protein 1 n=2 Tax=Homo sapiens TaxID=9606 RepID=F8WBJ4_HUMAN|nr:makorin ring finger protein 1 [Homo sapiens]KAI4016056.1 makorin ring finger protein 1 [Homo sapiens]
MAEAATPGTTATTSGAGAAAATAAAASPTPIPTVTAPSLGAGGGGGGSDGSGGGWTKQVTCRRSLSGVILVHCNLWAPPNPLRVQAILPQPPK